MFQTCGGLRVTPRSILLRTYVDPKARYDKDEFDLIHARDISGYVSDRVGVLQDFFKYARIFAFWYI